MKPAAASGAVVSAFAACLALGACSGAQPPSGTTPTPRATTPADAAPTVPAEFVTPEPLHEVVDDWTAGTVEVRTDSSRHLVGVRIASTSEQRSRGLMEVPDIPDGTGMWFTYPDDTDGGFWMFNTRADIDIAWVDAAGRIVAITSMQVCQEEPCEVYEPGASYRAALEVRANWFADNSVEVGDTIKLLDATP